MADLWDAWKGLAGGAAQALGAGAELVQSGVGLLDRLAVLPPAAAVGALGCATATVLAAVGEQDHAADAFARFRQTAEHLLATTLSAWVRGGAADLRHGIDAS